MQCRGRRDILLHLQGLSKDCSPFQGCLSVRWKYGEVKRSVNTTVEAYDENGIKFTRVGGGLLSQIFQHETDHLDGVLFIDKAKNVVDQKPEEEK